MLFFLIDPTYDEKFHDPDNIWYRYSNEPLKKSLERFVKFPIATTEEADQPRLLLVAVDVAEGIPVTFDSHATEDGSRKSEYGQFLKKDEKDPLFKYTIRYDEGITADHVIASGSFPVNFEYCKILVENNYTDITSSTTENVTKKGNTLFLGRRSYDQYTINAISITTQMVLVQDQRPER